MYDNEENVTKSVAEAARRVMEGIKAPEVLNEALKGDQHKLDKNKNNKIDAEDFKILRGEKKVNEESCEDEAEEAVDKHEKKLHGKKGEVSKHEKEMHNEETEIEEGTKMQIAKGRTRNVGTYGQAKGADFGGTDWDKEESGKEEKPKRAKYGSRQNYVRSKRVNEGFTDMLSVYNEGGIKSLLESLKNKEIEIEEEATNAEFTAELEKAKAKAEGREKANVAAASIQSVEVQEEVDLNEDIMGYKIRQKHQDKWRVHSPSGEHIGDVTKHENGYQYHGGHATKWDGSENSPHYKTGVEKTKSSAASKVANIHKSSLNEEVEQIDELSKKTLGSYVKKSGVSQFVSGLRAGEKQPNLATVSQKAEKRQKGIGRAVTRLTKEEVEQIDEESTYKLGRASAETKDFPIKHKGEHVGMLQFHTSAGKLHHRVSTVIGVSHEKFSNHPDKDNMVNAHVQKHESEARQHFAKKLKEDVEQQSDRMTGMNESSGFLHMPKNYTEISKNEYDKHLSNRIGVERNKGIKNLKDTHTKTNKHGWKTHEIVYHHGGQKQHGIPHIAKTTNLDNNKSKFYKENGVNEEVELEERTLTEPEMKKKEDVVKGMKKNLSSFKQRYGDRAKEVMYATATKLAKKEVEDHWRKGYHHVREPISDEPYLDNARGRFNELKKNNPHKKGTPEHKEWHSGASAAYEEHKDMLKGN